MLVCGREISNNTIAQIQALVEREPELSRRALSREVCSWLDWRSPSGALQEMSCRKALLSLERGGHLLLPVARQVPQFSSKKLRAAAPLPVVDVPEIASSLSALGKISVLPVGSRYNKKSKLWRSLMEHFHYLGAGPLCGAQMRYVVEDEAGRSLGALAFSAASFSLTARDKHIGWSEKAHRANLNCVVCNSRFLILPSVQVKNLASHVLGLALGRLADDWEQRYGIRPVLAETFVDKSRFSGTCYAASNWEEVGRTAGRRDGVRKAVYVRPLCRHWRAALCAEPPAGLRGVGLNTPPSDWAEEEFGRTQVYDRRLLKRLCTIARDFYGAPVSNIPEACGSKARTMAAYRFFSNEKVNMDVILEGHAEAVVNRIREHKVVLAPQDTTFLDYSTRPMTQGLGPTGTLKDSSMGLILHDTLAFTEEGTPLGVLDAQCWARDPENRGKRNDRKKLPIEQKESMKWLRSFRRVAQVQQLCPDTMLVSMGDRESDIHELFAEAVADPAGPKLLVRMNSAVQRSEEGGPLWEVMGGKEVAGVLALHIPHSGNRKARDTQLDIRFSQVNIKPPRRCKEQPNIEVWAVYAVERPEFVKNGKPVEWMLLSTVPVNSFEDAEERMQWYSRRWGIEVYHRTLKSGCRIKDRQLGNADRLETCLGIDMVVAWRVYHLAMLGRETPGLPCTAFFKDEEWKALCCYISKCPIPPKEPPALGEAMRMVGRIGGHLGRKADGPPGTQTLWRGLQRLDTATEMFIIFNNPPP